MSLTDSNKKKNYSNISSGNKNKVIRDESDKNIKVSKVITITDKLLLKKLQNKGGSIRKSKLLNKRIFDTMTKKEWNKYKNK